MSGARKYICVLGWPIAHSRSPLIHNYWIKQYGLDAEYRREEVAPDKFAEFVGRLREQGYIGANVTVPVSATLDLVGSYDYGKSGRFDSLVGAANGDLTNYWQRAFYVGVRLKQLYSKSDVRNGRNYYYDERPLVGSPVLPPVGESH